MGEGVRGCRGFVGEEEEKGKEREGKESRGIFWKEKRKKFW